MRPVLAVALLALVVSAGCAGPAGDDPTETTVESPETTSEDPETTTATRSTQATTTASEPQKGDQLLSVSELNESQAKKFDASKRVAFENLSEERQQVVKQAIECDCNVELDDEFDFNNEDRIEVVYYDGTYYFLRVSIV
jgi:hypothetical protein